MEGEVQKGSDKPGMLLHVLFQLLYCSNGYIGGWLAGGWCVGGKWWLSLRHGGRSQKKKKRKSPHIIHTYLQQNLTTVPLLADQAYCCTAAATVGSSVGGAWVERGTDQNVYIDSILSAWRIGRQETRICSFCGF